MSTINEMKTVAEQIKNATVDGENTATRVGGLLSDIVDHLGNGSGSSSGTGTVTGVMVDNVVYNPSGGIVELPNYPTMLPSSDVLLSGRILTVKGTSIAIPENSGGGGSGSGVDLLSVWKSLTNNDALVNYGTSTKISSDHLDFSNYSWWGRSLSDANNTKTVKGSLDGDIDYIRFSNGIKIGIDPTSSNNALRVYRDGTDATSQSSANFYATGGVSALGYNSGSGGSGGGGSSLNSLLSSLNNWNALPSASDLNKMLVWKGGADTWAWEDKPTGSGSAPANYIVSASKSNGGNTLTLTPNTGDPIVFTPSSGSGTSVQSNWAETDSSDPSFILNKPALKQVATSADYLDLENVPTKLSDFTNDSGFITQHQDISGKADASAVTGTFWGHSYSLNNKTVDGDMLNVGTITMNKNGVNFIQGPSGIEMSGSDYNGGYIDFHYGNAFGSYPSGEDYLSRIIEIADDSSGYSGHTCLNVISDGLRISARDNSNLAPYLRIGDGMLVWDSTNNAIKVIHKNGTTANLYATGSVSALGMGSNSGNGDNSGNGNGNGNVDTNIYHIFYDNCSPENSQVVSNASMSNGDLFIDYMHGGIWLIENDSPVKVADKLKQPLISINTSSLSAPSSSEDGKTLVWNNTSGEWEYGSVGGVLSAATTSAYGGIKLLENASSATIGGSSSNDSNRNYPVRLTTGGVAYVNVPWASDNTIADGSVTTSKLANVAVTTPKIANGAVTVEKISNEVNDTYITTDSLANLCAVLKQELGIVIHSSYDIHYHVMKYKALTTGYYYYNRTLNVTGEVEFSITNPIVHIDTMNNKILVCVYDDASHLYVRYYSNGTVVHSPDSQEYIDGYISDLLSVIISAIQTAYNYTVTIDGDGYDINTPTNIKSLGLQ